MAAGRRPRAPRRHGRDPRPRPARAGLCHRAREIGAATIIVVVGKGERDRFRVDVARRLGATHTLNLDDGPVADQVRSITGGDGADIVVDITSGARDAVSDALDLARIGGTIVVAGAEEGRPTTGFQADKLFTKELTVRGVWGHDYRSVRTAIELLESGRYPFDLLCTHRFDLEEADHGLRTLGGEGEADAIHVTITPT